MSRNNHFKLKQSKARLYILSILFAFIFFSFLGLILPLNRSVAFADSPAPMTSYSITLEDGAKFFYMRGTEPMDEGANQLELESGLYHANTNEPIYLLEPLEYKGYFYDRYIYEEHLVISNDGVYLANLPWTPASHFFDRSGIAMEFYKNGSISKTYKLSQLVNSSNGLSYSVSHVTWENREKRVFDSDNNTLLVTTNSNKVYVFDLTSGVMIKGSNNALAVQIGVISSIAISALIIIVIKRDRKKLQTTALS